MSGGPMFQKISSSTTNSENSRACPSPNTVRPLGPSRRPRLINQFCTVGNHKKMDRHPKLATQFKHVKGTEGSFVSGGLRDFFVYRDLGVADATHGKVTAQLVRANNPPEAGTGWHTHTADFHIVYMIKGWARFMYEDEVTLVEAGDCVHQAPGIRHFLFDYSADMEYLEVVGPADFGSIEAQGPCSVPAPTPWQT